MKLFVYVIFSLSCGAFAQTSSVSLREQATNEMKVESQNQKTASDAQVSSGMLSLKDPRPEVVTRSWKYFAGFTAENFQPRGKVSTESVGDFNLGNNSSTFMPGLVAGFLTSDIKTGPIAWKLGLRGNAAFSSQGTSLTFQNGYRVDDARLNSTLLAVGPMATLQWEKLQWLSLTFVPQYGTVNYTQTSSNEFARFSKQTGYSALNFGLDFQFAKQWSIFTEYSQRNMRDEHQEIALEKDNFELGTKVTW